MKGQMDDSIAVPSDRCSTTPGPWIVKQDTGLRQRIQTSGDKGTIAYMTARPFSYGSNFSHAQISANARLIALAPDMLGAICYYATIDGPVGVMAKGVLKKLEAA